MSDKVEIVKKILDEDCRQKRGFSNQYNFKCSEAEPRGILIGKPCWACGKNRNLAEKIADAIEARI